MHSSGRLRIPPSLRVAFVGAGAVALSCSSGSSSSKGDASTDSSVADAAFDGGPCRIDVPDGDICVTTCWLEPETKGPDTPSACQVYCNLKTNECYLEGGLDDFNCNYGDGKVLC